MSLPAGLSGGGQEGEGAPVRAHSSFRRQESGSSRRTSSRSPESNRTGSKVSRVPVHAVTSFREVCRLESEASKRAGSEVSRRRSSEVVQRRPYSAWLRDVMASPKTGMLCICFCMLLYCIAEIYLPPPFGINTSQSGGLECEGDEFQLESFCICPRETVCVKTLKDLVFLGLARCSAYFDYPLYMLLFLSKAHNLRGFLQRKYVAVWLPLDDLHELHSFAGSIVGLEVMWHSFWHVLRWYLAGDTHLLLEHVTGISGLISVTLTPIIVWPMLLRKLRQSIKYEVRKAAHYLAVVWGLAICFHAPKRHIAWVMGSVVGVYLLDWLYGLFFRIELIDTLQFTRLGSAVEVVWECPEGFMKGWSGAGYVYLCLPWVSKSEWHAFSLVKHPTLPNRCCVCMALVGDWTEAVHKELRKPSVRPGWVYGPFPSPFSTAIHYDNLITVASGIGITPAVSTMTSLKGRLVHLVWMCRDPDLVEFYLKNTIHRRRDAWSFIFYTGKRKLLLSEDLRSRFVKIILGRPDLHDLLAAIMDNVSNGLPMPAELMDAARDAEHQLYERSPQALRFDALERAFATYTVEEMFDMCHDMSSAVVKWGTDSMPRTTSAPTSLDSYVFDCEAVDADASLILSHSHQLSRAVVPSRVTLDAFIKMVRQVCHVDEHLTTEGVLSDEQLAGHYAAAAPTAEYEDGLDCEELAEVLLNLRNAAEAAATEARVKEEREEEEEPVKHWGSRKSSTIRLANPEQLREMLSSWQVMYCGGGGPVAKTLEQFSQRYQVPVKFESFQW